MRSALKTEFERLRAGGWQCLPSGDTKTLPAHVLARYSWIPADVLEALCGFREVMSPDEGFWLITAASFSGEDGLAFSWDEWENLSLGAAQDDGEWIVRIREFWDRHLPVAMSVTDGYEYHALRPDGTVVCGREPEFEETVPFAPSYCDFLKRIASSGSTWTDLPP